MIAYSILYPFVFQWILNFGSVQTQYGFYEFGQGHFQGFVTYHTLGMFAISLFVFVIVSLEGSNRQKGFSGCYGGWSYNLLVYAIVIVTFFRLSAFFANVTSRISYYFIPFIMIAFPYALNRVTVKKRKILKFIMICILTLFYFIVLTRAKDNWGTVPFKWCNIL